MELCHIFSPTKFSDEGLWACKYDGEPKDAYRSLLEQWEDPEWMRNFCAAHSADVEASFGAGISAGTAAKMLMMEADELLQLVFDCAACHPEGSNLQEVFKPLNNNDGFLIILQPSKGHLQRPHLRRASFNRARLRIYGIRIGENTFVVTGGAIKLTHLMQDRDHTREQLDRMKTVRDWLRGEGIQYPEDLTQA